MRSLTLSIALLCAGFSTAHAQQFLLEAGAGATLVGDTFFVQTGQNFTVRAILDMQGTTATVRSLTTALAYSIDGALNNKLSYVSGFGNAQILAVLPDVSPLPNFWDRQAALRDPANYSSAPGQLPRVIYAFFGAPTPGNAQLQGTYILSDTTFTNTLSAGEIYGDATDETGLFMATQTGNVTPQLGASGFTGKRFGSPKYKVQAVPEPASMTALGFAGLAFLRMRRKSA